MKLATYYDGSRDGQLVVVSRDLALAHYATGIASRMQPVLDDWNFLAPQLEDLYTTLNHGKARHAFPFEPAKCMAPLPRSSQWAQAMAYPSHLDRLRATGLLAEGAEALPARSSRNGARRDGAAASGPLIVQCASDGLRGPCGDVPFSPEDRGIDMEPGLAVVTGDIDQGADPAQALEGVRLFVLLAGWRVRGEGRSAAAEQAAEAWAWLRPQPPASFGPVAVTPDELGPAWRAGRAHLALHTQVEGRSLARGDTGTDMAWHFGQLLASLARVRPLHAGSLLGAGPVSHRDASLGAHGLAERWAIKQLAAQAEAAEAALRTEAGDGGAGGAPLAPPEAEASAHKPARRRVKPFSGLRWGDRVRIEAIGQDGQSVFGAIEATVADRA